MTTNRVNLTPEQSKVIEIALRALTGRELSDADKQWVASPVGLATASMTWSSVSALRNYHVAAGNLSN